jgi:hypothetical protein
MIAVHLNSYACVYICTYIYICIYAYINMDPSAQEGMRDQVGGIWLRGERAVSQL